MVSKVAYTDNGNLKGEDSERVVSKVVWFLIKGVFRLGFHCIFAHTKKYTLQDTDLLMKSAKKKI